ncbi:trpE operon leader peptide TrpLE [Sinorhizobium alkalisoli]|nr:trpE operon leader peptide TrpLE [Ensifer sp. NBAIM29]MCG5479079.1 trpE operon leader peptide TrpLE [Sinorhizobium alkalisoli]
MATARNISVWWWVR